MTYQMATRSRGWLITINRQGKSTGSSRGETGYDNLDIQEGRHFEVHFIFDTIWPAQKCDASDIDMCDLKKDVSAQFPISSNCPTIRSRGQGVYPRPH